MNLWLPGPVHLLVLLAALTALAYRSGDRPAGKWVRRLLVVLTLWAWIFTTPGFANLARGVLEGTPGDVERMVSGRAGHAQIVVLPSGRAYSGSGRPLAQPDEIGSERLRCAIDLWRRVGGVLLLSGGPDSPGEESVAEIMRKGAQGAGVPSEAIRMVKGARTTHEDLLLARDAIASHAGPTWLVTSAVHMPRAQAVARKQGLSMLPYPCDYRKIEELEWYFWIPRTRGPGYWHDVLHELVGRQYYRLRGWAD